MNTKKQRSKNRRKAQKLVEQAWEAAEAGHDSLAVRIIKRAADRDPGNPIIWLDQGMLLVKSGDDEHAATALQTALTLAPELAEAYAQLAAIRTRQGMIDAAVALQEQAIHHAPGVDRYQTSLAAYCALSVRSDGIERGESHADRDSSDAACPIEQACRANHPALSRRVEAIDWPAVEQSLQERGFALMPGLLDAEACQSLRELYHRDELFAESVVMDKAHFGSGSYRYFAAPIPTVVDAIRRIAYPYVATIANQWQQMLSAKGRYPLAWEGMRIRCAQSDQSTPTPIMLRYERGGFNALHRDVRGPVYFPIQLAIVLSPRRSDPTEQAEGFSGGEFLFADSGTCKSKQQAIPAGLGDAVLFCTRARLVSVAGTYGLQPVKHGAAEVTAGTRYVLGVPFHEFT